jgi:hypothetical protein
MTWPGGEPGSPRRDRSLTQNEGVREQSTQNIWAKERWDDSSVKVAAQWEALWLEPSTKYYYDYQSQENEIGGECSTYARSEMRTKFWLESMKEETI